MDWGVLASWSGLVVTVLGSIGTIVVLGIQRDLNRNTTDIKDAVAQGRADVKDAKLSTDQSIREAEARLMERVKALEDWQKSGKGREP